MNITLCPKKISSSFPNIILNSFEHFVYYRIAESYDLSKLVTTRIKKINNITGTDPFFNHNISSYDTSNVTDMSGAFSKQLFLIRISVRGIRAVLLQ